MVQVTQASRDQTLLIEPLSAYAASIPGKASLISIVDDDEWVCRSLARLLKSRGFRARAFFSAEEYLLFGNHHETVCLLLDVRLPGMSGFQLQRDLAAKQNEVPVIVISAFDEPEVQARALAGGAVAFLGKPFDDKSLMEALANVQKQQGGTQYRRE